MNFYKGVFAGSISKNNTFTPGTVISSSQINSNFDQIFAELNAKETRITTLEAGGGSGHANVWSADRTNFLAGANSGGPVSTWTVIPGMSVSFTLTSAARIVMSASGTQRPSGGVLQAGYRFTLDGVGRGNATWGERVQMASDADATIWQMWSFSSYTTLAAGAHTITVEVISPAGQGFGFICGELGPSIPAYSMCTIVVQAFYQ